MPSHHKPETKKYPHKTIGCARDFGRADGPSLDLLPSPLPVRGNAPRSAIRPWGGMPISREARWRCGKSVLLLRSYDANVAAVARLDWTDRVYFLRKI
jgi:hypothetical protein